MPDPAPGPLTAPAAHTTIELRYRVTPEVARALGGTPPAPTAGCCPVVVVRLDLDGPAVRVQLRQGSDCVDLAPAALGLPAAGAPPRVIRADGLVHADWPGVGRVTLRNEQPIYAQLAMFQHLGGGRFESLDDARAED